MGSIIGGLMGGSKAPTPRAPAPKVRESISDRQGASSDARDKAKKRRGYEASQKTGTLLGGGGSDKMGGKSLLG